MVTTKEIRNVLKKWQNTNQIGELALAKLAIVDAWRSENTYQNSAAGRGRSVQELFLAAIEELWPADTEFTLADDPKRFRTILYQQFIKNRSATSVKDELRLSKASYFEKQRKALQLLAAKLAEWEAQHSQRSGESFTGSYRPPLAASFVGRQAELAYYHNGLIEHNYVVIPGFPGTGKTTLAIRLAHEVAKIDSVFWYKCRSGDDVDAVLWALAGFLYQHERPALWHSVNNSRQAETSATPLSERIRLAIQLLSSGNYLVCLDDFQSIDEEPGVRQLAEALYEATQEFRLRMIITSQRIPPYMPRIFEPLTGMSSQDAQAFLAAQGVDLSPQQFQQVHAQLGGHALMLTFVAELLKDGGSSVQLIEQLSNTAVIEHYLLHAVDGQLEDDERSIMGCLALLGDEGGGRNAIETVLDGGSVRWALRQLSARNLLSEEKRDVEDVYSQHATVRAFYYDNLGLRERQTMHARAARYYRDHAKPLQAANHYFFADEVTSAIELSTEQVRALLHQGQAGQLRRLLERLNQLELEPWHRGRVQIALGKLYTFTQQREAAQSSFQQALRLMQEHPAIDGVQNLKFDAYRGLAYLLRSSLPTDALRWLEQGLTELADSDPRWMADLLIQKGIVLRRMKHGSEALNTLHEGVAYLQSPRIAEGDPAVERLRLLGWMNLGVSYYFHGELQKSEGFLERALRQAITVRDDFNRLGVQNNLAVLHQLNGRWPSALNSYQVAIELADKLGNQIDQLHALINLGILHHQMGEHDQAAENLEQAILLAHQHQKHDQLITALAYLAETRLSQGHMDEVLSGLSAAEQLSLESSIELQLPMIYRLRACHHLAAGNPKAALADAEKSLALCSQVGMQTEVGPGLRVLGEIQSALGNAREAEECFAHSLEQVAGVPYEEALTQHAWGCHLLEMNEFERGRELIQTAQNTFHRLGAVHDLEKMTGPIEQIRKG